MFLKLSLNILLYIFVMTMVSCLNDHKLIGIASLHYKLKISLMPGYVSHGESNITVYIRGPTQNMTLLTSKRINVTTVHLIADDNKKVYKPKLSYNHNKNNVVLNFIELVYPNISLEFGYYTLSVKFLNFDTEELSQTWYTNEKENKKFIATLFQFAKKRPLFPCFNTFEFVTFNISVEHDRRYTVLSNMPIKNQFISNDVMLTHFHSYPATHIYDVALILMSPNMTPSNPIEYDTYLASSSKIKINTWSRSHLVPHMKFAQHVLGNVTMYLDDNWNIMRKGPKVDYVVIPNFEGNIKQPWGLLLYNETYLLYSEELYSAAYKGTIMRSIVHDIIYQWFEDFFYPPWYNYRGLHEGFIKFVEAYIIDKVFPNSRMMDLFIIQDLYEYHYMDILTSSYNYSEDVMTYNDIFKINLLSIRQHIKGPIIWRMLASVIPHDVFWESIYIFLNTYSLKSFNSRLPDDLWNIMQILIDRSEFKNHNINVKQMMNVWTEQQYCFVLNATRNYNGLIVSAIISTNKTQSFDHTIYFIPITYTTERNINFDIKPLSINDYLTDLDSQILLPIGYRGYWFIVNKQQTGYYRVNYDPENWQTIARYLKLENYANIHVLNRAQIIDDAFYFMLEKKLNSSIFWDLASYLPRREKDYIAWYPMIKAFEYLSYSFALRKAQGYGLPEVLQKCYEALYQMRPAEDDFNKYLKLDLTKWGCVFNNYLCIQMARDKLELYVLNRTLNKISTGWEEWTYCNGLKTANESMWYTVYLMASSTFQEKSDYKIFKCLGCSENPNIVVKYLWFVLPDIKYEMLEKNDYKMLTQKNMKNKKKINSLINNMFLSTLARHTKNSQVLPAILTSYKKYYKKSPVHMIKALNVLINNVYTHKDLFEKVLQFLIDNIKYSPRYDQYYQKLLAKINTRSRQLRHQVQFSNNLLE
ncbi:thyrotropin-releasing hormone-degrading ectoenzyme-like [Nylanderia fulva]|uniref:thyrotropin-releasing hormone-degrading ectoenzyme-like n=1 Tax=Nylanderia fulva TaxID=613905 RepID=UPI0010FB2187|nr:thyrotropin-releasing hormone-degrading ectoenzyme-like [Nylanderia fulva]